MAWRGIVQCHRWTREPLAPENVEDICGIFEEKGGWYKDAKKSEERWGTPIHVQLAIIHQESTFDLDDGWWIFG